MMLEAVESNAFKGVKIDGDTVEIMHRQFANVAFCLGEWTSENASNLILLLGCFEEASGLKINIQKSRLFGVHSLLNERFPFHLFGTVGWGKY